jgi:hypothetical protein
MKKIYLILILVLVLSSSGVGLLVWSKKKEQKGELEEKQEEEKALSSAEKPIESKLKSEMPKELVTAIRIDYVDTNKRELSYSMHYKGISHKGTFKDGDQDSFVIKSFGRFVVVKPMKKEAGTLDLDASKKRGIVKGQSSANAVAITAEDYYNDSFVYLAIYNKKQLVTGLKVNLQTGEEIQGLPTEWEQLED